MKRKKKRDLAPRPHGRSLLEMNVQIVRTDNTFESVVGGFKGKCIFCNGPICVSFSGHSTGTLEHIVPIHAGGTNDLHNLALAHSSCNSEKGVRHDPKYPRDARAVEVVERLLQKRLERWRDDI